MSILYSQFLQILQDIDDVIMTFLFYEPAVDGSDSMWLSYDYMFPSVFKMLVYISFVLLAFSLFRSFSRS